MSLLYCSIHFSCIVCLWFKIFFDVRRYLKSFSSKKKKKRKKERRKKERKEKKRKEKKEKRFPLTLNFLGKYDDF